MSRPSPSGEPEREQTLEDPRAEALRQSYLRERELDELLDGLPIDREAARKAAAWLLRSSPTMTSCRDSGTAEQLMLFPDTVGTATAHCDHCDQYYRASEEPDPYIARLLPGVAGCCCGHGDPSRAYVDLEAA